MYAVEIYRTTDAADAAALLNSVPEVPNITEAAFRSFTELTFNRGARDFRVVRVEGRLTALLTSTLFDEGDGLIRHFRIVVHPEHRRHGLASRLLEEVEAQEGSERAIRQCNSQRSWSSGNGFLESKGFGLVGRELLMRLSHEPAERALADGVQVRAATPQDDALWAELHGVGYAQREDYFPLSAEDLAIERNRPDFTLLLAEVAGRVVGLCHGYRDQGTEGLLNSVVVRPEQRGRGIAAALVTRAIGTLRALGNTNITLNVVSTNAPATRLYTRLGFDTYDEIWTFQRRVEGP
ncbi:MAG TPA: GNAT family N-acetyltransferase [Polyangiaceae bacterium]|nr:GNAT family N-acetyltransferase [Polyangiaceae bacterium]